MELAERVNEEYLRILPAAKKEGKGELERDSELLETIKEVTTYPGQVPFAPFEKAGMVFDVINSEEVLLEAFRLRYKAYLEVGYINPANFPLKMEFDIYDIASIHFIARDKEGELAGYVRVIMDTKLDLPTGALVDISDYRKRYAICEISRNISYPRHQPEMNRKIRWMAYQWAEYFGIEQMIGISLVDNKGWFDHNHIEPLDPPRGCRFDEYHNFGKNRGGEMYANTFDVKRNREFISSLGR